MFEQAEPCRSSRATINLLLKKLNIQSTVKPKIINETVLNFKMRHFCFFF